MVIYGHILFWLIKVCSTGSLAGFKLQTLESAATHSDLPSFGLLLYDYFPLIAFNIVKYKTHPIFPKSKFWLGRRGRLEGKICFMFILKLLKFVFNLTVWNNGCGVFGFEWVCALALLVRNLCKLCKIQPKSYSTTKLITFFVIVFLR